MLVLRLTPNYGAAETTNSSLVAALHRLTGQRKCWLSHFCIIPVYIYIFFFFFCTGKRSCSPGARVGLMRERFLNFVPKISPQDTRETTFTKVAITISGIDLTGEPNLRPLSCFCVASLWRRETQRCNLKFSLFFFLFFF